uniref:JmjC domain-containing protein n=1 Tax=Globodera rostochiensis TaxID=31243 RepID=A0A914H9U4_GLORO
MQLLDSCSGVYPQMSNTPPDDAFRCLGVCAPLGCSAFALHREEEHVHHLNYNFGPGIKLWLFIGAEWEEAVKALGQRLFADRWPPCPNPLGHVSFFFSPQQLRSAKIPFRFHVQRPGEAVLTVGLHCGINLGASVCVVKEFCNIRPPERSKRLAKAPAALAGQIRIASRMSRGGKRYGLPTPNGNGLPTPNGNGLPTPNGNGLPTPTSRLQMTKSFGFNCPTFFTGWSGRAGERESNDRA